MSDARISLSEMHQPLRDEPVPVAKGASMSTLSIAVALVLAAGLVIVAIGQHKLLNQTAAADDALPTDPMARAIALMTKYPLIDGHNDLAWQYRINMGGQVYTDPTYDLTIDETPALLQTDLPKIATGHLGAQFWSVYVRCNMTDAVRATLEEIDIAKSFVQKYSSNLQMAYTSADITQIFATGRTASLMGIEGGHSIDSSLGALRQFYALGVRYMTLTHTCNNAWAQSCDNSEWHAYEGVKGLTSNGAANPLDGPFCGQQVVLEMNRIGMMVDLSHVDASTMRDALAITQAPVIFSHSAAFGLVPNPRNVPDDVILSLAQNGGIMMVPFYNNFTNWRGPNTVNNASNVADHFDYVKRLLGGSVANLGVGSDFEGGDDFAEFPADLQNVSMYPNLFAELIARGYTDEQIVAILGGNLQRVMAAVENVASTLQTQRSQGEKRLICNETCRSNY